MYVNKYQERCQAALLTFRKTPGCPRGRCQMAGVILLLHSQPCEALDLAMRVEGKSDTNTHQSVRINSAQRVTSVLENPDFAVLIR